MPMPSYSGTSPNGHTRHLGAIAVIACLCFASAPSSAQRFPVNDPTLRMIWNEGIGRSRLRDLAEVLLDSIGPRLTGSPADLAGHDWLVATYARWGIRAHNEQYA